MFLFSASDARLCQKPGNICVTRSWQQACVTGTGTKGCFNRISKTNERGHQKLSSLVAWSAQWTYTVALWMPPLSHFSVVSFLCVLRSDAIYSGSFDLLKKERMPPTKNAILSLSGFLQAAALSQHEEVCKG